MLAQPVHRRLLITGEATSHASPATVHGAFASGLRSADLIRENRDRNTNVTVVGAGASGIACARSLRDSGFDVQVVEARDRIGGRVWSETLDGVPAEMGASWIHGVTGNPLVGLAERAGVATLPFAYDYNFVDAQQRRLALSGEAQVRRGLRSFKGGYAESATASVGSLFPLRQGPGLAWALAYEITHEFAADPDELSVLGRREGEYVLGGDRIVAGAYSKLFDAVLGDITLKTSSVVTAVELDRSGAIVELEDGERLRCDAVVLTVPIGVLKGGSIDFRPGLPNVNRVAIERLGAGVMDKLWLSFDEAFWPADAELFQWIDPGRPGLWAEWVNGNHYLDKPLLLGFNAGSIARDFGRKSDQQVLESAMVTLEAMFA